MSKTGYFEHWERDHLGSTGKYDVYKSTIKTYNESIKTENYSLGFLIASSLLTDRINSLWVLIEWRRRMDNIFPENKNQKLHEIIPLSKFDEVEIKRIDSELKLEKSRHLESDELVYRVKPTPSNVLSETSEMKINSIHSLGIISSRMKKTTLFLIEVKEILSNLSMWNSERYSKENCEKFFKEFRKYDKIVREYKNLYQID